MWVQMDTAKSVSFRGGMLIVFDCTCDWRWIIGGNNEFVYGPLYDATNASQARFKVYSRGRLQTFEQWNDEYADCAKAYYTWLMEEGK